MAFAATSPSTGSSTITLTTGQRAAGSNFGYREVSPAGTISGSSFEDRDSDGAFDTGELSTTTTAGGGWSSATFPRRFTPYARCCRPASARPCPRPAPATG